MSLFGDDPDQPAPSISKSKGLSSSLFDDEPSAASKSTSSLFADEDTTSGGSPWGIPTPKKSGRGNLIKSLLPASAVPESYIDAFDTLLASDGEGAGISETGVMKVLESSGITTGEQLSIQKVVSTGGAVLGRNEFNVLVALIGLAQEGEDANLDGVDDRRKSLPQPNLPYLNQVKSAKAAEAAAPKLDTTPVRPTAIQQPSEGSPTKSRKLRSDSLEDPAIDPWAAPATAKPQTQPVHNSASSNGPTAAIPISTGNSNHPRTTSAFTTNSEDPGLDDAAGARPADGWGSYGNTGAGFAGDGAAGFGSGNDDVPIPRPPRHVGGGRTTSRGVEETVTITLLPDKEGMFMFQHRNYEVKSARRASTVVRRYSDFVWLLDCLHKRYPFRQLPLLPPKRVAVNGRHLSSDVTFIEKRRRGLVRFTNALVRHPILSQEQLVVMFLTVPTELAVWRKQATISVQEEFTGKSLPAGLEESLPKTLMDTFDTVRNGVKKSADSYIGLCNLLERLAKRNQGMAADSLRFSQALVSLTEESESTYATDTNDVPLMNEGIKSTARHLETCQTLMEDEAKAWDEGALEDFKRQRDTLVSIRDMFDRRDRFAKDNIPQLERRIEANEAKLSQIKSKPEGTVKPGEAEKVEQAILADKQSIVAQHARGVFIKECIRDELLFFQSSQYHVSKLHQDWSQERVKYSELQADNWRALSEEVENMPLGD